MTWQPSIEAYRGEKPPTCTPAELDAYCAGTLRAKDRPRVFLCIALALYESMPYPDRMAIDVAVDALRLEYTRCNGGNPRGFGIQSAFVLLFAVAMSGVIP